MEFIISGLGGLAILGLIAIAGVVVYVLAHRLIRGKRPKFSGNIGLSKCPLCGGRMETAIGTPHFVHCSTPRCPNFHTMI